MIRLLCSFLLVLCFVSSTIAATVNFSACIDNGLSLADGSNVPPRWLVRLGFFRDPSSGAQLTDAQIQALAHSPAQLDGSFVEVAAKRIDNGRGYGTGHFAAAATADTAALNVAGKQIYLWVFNAPTLAAATQHGIYYWSSMNMGDNPDGTLETPGARWKFPAQSPAPGITTIDLTDLTTGTSTLAAGARVVVGTFPAGASTFTGAPNFGLAPIYTALTILTPSPLPRGGAHRQYYWSLVAGAGTPPYRWTVAAGALPPGVELNSDGVLFGDPGITGTFNFTAQVTDAALATATRDFAVTIGVSPSIVTPAPLPDAMAGVAYSQSFTASDGFAPYSWSVDTRTLPAGLTMSSAGVLSGTPSTPGNFSVTVRLKDNFTVWLVDEFDFSATKTFALKIAPAFVIPTEARLPEGVLGVPYSRTLAAVGGTSPYTWRAVAVTLPVGLTLDAAGILSGTPTKAGSFPFTALIADGAGLTTFKDFTITIASKRSTPIVTTPAFPTAIVSGAFSFTLEAANYPARFGVSGLPSGLSYVSTTGVISGRPLAAGTFTITVRAANSGGTSAPVTATLNVEPLPAGTAGTYMGLIASQYRIGGRIDLAIAATGVFSGKVTQDGVARAFTGHLDTAIGSAPRLSAEVKFFAVGGNIILGSLTLAFTFDPTAQTFTGTLSGSPVSGWRQIWNAKTNPATSRAGYYTAALDIQPPDEGNAAIPQGTGFLNFSVPTSGVLRVAGKTADGNTISTAGFIGPRGQIAVYQSRYGKFGGLSGLLTLAPGAVSEDNAVSGAVTWFKPGNTARAYAEGFGPIALGVVGKYLVAAPSGHVVLGLPDSAGSARLLFREGGLASAAIDPDIAAFTYTAARKVVLPAQNPAKTTLSINAATGAIGGHFTLVDGKLARTVTYQGCIVRPPSGALRAIGYFLLPQIPVAPQTINTSPALSGQVVIEQ